ncbi:uncharacterized protein [Panulirus ornatus]|uniref:uncharacterized protein isoform X2 n=1 Tax=Panulirus ornatus TaxID=150431 RepID=UPI003A87F01E
MYAELSFLERIAFPRDTAVFGKLWVGHVAAEGEGQFLKITSCPVPPCICNSECHYYKVDDTWFMLVANDYDPEDLVDPYTVTSKVFAWNSFSESFTVVAEYVADHTTTGMFMTSNLPVKESFFTLAQLKVADHPHFEDNVKYTAGVLVVVHYMISLCLILCHMQ